MNMEINRRPLQSANESLSYFLFNVWVFAFTLLLQSGGCQSQKEKDNACWQYKGPRPKIFPLNRAIDQYNLKGDPRQNSVDLLGIRNENDAYLSRQFNCTFNKPIHWVFHIDPLETATNVNIDFSERISKRKISRENESFLEEEFEYTSNFRLLYFTNELRHSETNLFSCEPYSNLGEKSLDQLNCQRSFIQVLGVNIQNDAVETVQSFLSNISERLLNSSLLNGIEPMNRSDCKTRLLIKVEWGNVINYKWESDNNSSNLLEQTSFLTNETSFFENAFRLTDKVQEIGCTQLLSPDDSCDPCTPIGNSDPLTWNVTANFSNNGVIFYAKYEDGIRVYKGHFSVPKESRLERRFYFDWEINNSVLMEDMIQLKAPEIVYHGIPFQIECHVSRFQFAYGSVVATSEEPFQHWLGQDRMPEVWQPNGYRKIKISMKFKGSAKLNSVSCHAPMRKSKDWISKFQTVTVEEPIPAMINHSKMNSSEFHKISPEMKGLNIDCNVSGNPEPEFEFEFPEKLEETKLETLELVSNGTFHRIVFPTWDNVYSGTYICKARNRFGLVTRTITFASEEPASKLAVIVSSTLGSLVIILAFGTGILAWKIRLQRLNHEHEMQKIIDEFRNGIKLENADKDHLNHANFSILQLPYNESFEVKRNLWNIEDKILGSGQFGIVRMGSVKPTDNNTIKVAVKTLKSTVDNDEFKSFLFELKIMAYLGHHKNIVSLISACTEGINDRDILIGVELCDNGSLLDYLRKYRGSFRNMVTSDGKLISDSNQIEYDSKCGDVYANLSTFTVSTYDLYRWSYHIACGMDYLRTKKVLHGDLAARNVLLCQRKVAKVGDFGMSRVLMSSDNYTKKTQTALPWKWMPVESLRDRVFSIQSDVWAYGISLYEIFTLGQSPYPGISWSPDFISKLENGLRMEKPVFCNATVYKVMRSCWHNIPHHRPTYSKIKRKLSQGLRRLSGINNDVSSVKSQAQKLNQNRMLMPRTSSQTTNSTTSQPNFTVTSVDDDIGGIYSNIHRSTMNYYKNV